MKKIEIDVYEPNPDPRDPYSRFIETLSEEVITCWLGRAYYQVPKDHLIEHGKVFLGQGEIVFSAIAPNDGTIVNDDDFYVFLVFNKKVEKKAFAVIYEAVEYLEESYKKYSGVKI